LIDDGYASPSVDRSESIELVQTSHMKIILLDGLNYYTRTQMSQKSHWDLESFVKRVEKIVEAFRNSEYDLRVFIDATRLTPEAQNKQTSRTTRRIIKEDYDYPPFKETLLGDAFKLLDIPVYYSFEADNDDTIAAYAQKYNASVLSQDQDFFRYIDRTFHIYDDYTIKKGRVKLKNATERQKEGKRISKRKILEPPVTCATMPFFAWSAKQYRIFTSPTPLLKLLGNPFMETRCLRQALYAQYQIVSVTEVIPIWSNDNVEWSTEVVYPDVKHLHLLAEPELALRTILAKYMIRPNHVDDKEWSHHLFGVYSTVYECTAASTSTSLLSLLRPLAIQHMKNRDPEVFHYECIDCSTPLQVIETDEFYQRIKHSKTRRCKRCHWRFKRSKLTPLAEVS
jgi:DNA-directed RNA polymerase subunit RPC12/RpoP